jgi:hypothetical protein
MPLSTIELHVARGVAVLELADARTPGGADVEGVLDDARTRFSWPPPKPVEADDLVIRAAPRAGRQRVTRGTR